MKKKTINFVHLMIKEYDDVLSKNKKKFYNKYMEALEFDRQFQLQELLNKTRNNESDVVNIKSMHVVKKFETISWKKGKAFTIYLITIYYLLLLRYHVCFFYFLVCQSSDFWFWDDKKHSYTLKKYHYPVIRAW